MIKLRQAIVVEGRYDKNALCHGCANRLDG